MIILTDRCKELIKFYKYKNPIIGIMLNRNWRDINYSHILIIIVQDEHLIIRLTQLKNVLYLCDLERKMYFLSVCFFLLFIYFMVLYCASTRNTFSRFLRNY